MGHVLSEVPRTILASGKVAGPMDPSVKLRGGIIATLEFFNIKLVN